MNNFTFYKIHKQENDTYFHVTATKKSNVVAQPMKMINV